MGWKKAEDIKPGDEFKFDGVWWKVPEKKTSVVSTEDTTTVEVVERDFPEETNAFIFDDSDTVWFDK